MGMMSVSGSLGWAMLPDRVNPRSQVVRQAYGARVAKASVAEGCCSGGGENDTATDVAKKLG